jgi:hypothetical protein
MAILWTLKMILVIRHTQERTEYDERGKILAEAGEVYVSHGINIENGKTVILPDEKWSNFRHNCVMYEGEWYLK